MPKIVKLEDGTEINIWMSDEVTTKVNEEREKARSEEKDKLYPEIQALKKSSTDAKAQLEAKQAELDALKTKDTSEGSKEQTAMLAEIEKVKKDFEIKTKELEVKNLELSEALNKESLERYKAEKLVGAGQEIIAEMVVGSTKEEIDAALEKAKLAYQKYAAKAPEKKDGEEIPPKVEEKDKKDDGLPPKVKDTPESGKDVLTAEDIHNMTPEEYRAKRDQILKQAKSHFKL